MSRFKISLQGNVYGNLSKFMMVLMPYNFGKVDGIFSISVLSQVNFHTGILNREFIQVRNSVLLRIIFIKIKARPKP